MARRRIVRTAPSTVLPVTNLVSEPNQLTHLPDLPSLMHLVLGPRIEVNIPETATLEQVEESMQLALKGYRLLSDALERIKPVIGRHLLHVATHRLYKPKYGGITEYITERMERDLGFSRNNSFEALRIAKGTPTMTMESYQRYGATRLLSAISHADEKDPEFQPLLEKSLTMTAMEFREYVKTLKTSKDEAKTFAVTARLPVEWQSTWDKLLSELGLTAGEVLQELITSYIEIHKDRVVAEPPMVRATAH